ncbi:DExH-box ATP-dependent RNA helicase DExH14 [Vitis vinifera]|uniref:DExH-box ATP-dependent RNA helicase DExH14 n=1 Tax=Vitis vinifera TaxID=29760 RepID=A0A438HME1_VITVI|nr:DExH-box ATP-dependent RNA helicase DExH14 [Vitis vinifera]
MGVGGEGRRGWFGLILGFWDLQRDLEFRKNKFWLVTLTFSCMCDLADWLGVGEIGLFNFKPSVRPVPLEVHIQVPTLKFILMKWTYVKRIRCLEEYT